MGNLILTFLIFIGSIAILGAATHISPKGFDRLRDIGLWMTVVGAVLPPLIYGVWAIRKSEDGALMLMLVLMTAAGAAGLAYLLGLFLPAYWPWWWSLVPGLVVWAVVWVFAFL
jgi:hypothetical protein